MLSFDREGLVPAVIQDDVTNEVLMVAFMNEAAFKATRETGFTHFYSRGRRALWRKGEQSGNAQEVRAIYVNCEENSLLIRVTQQGGAACHTGYRSCYYRRLLPDGSYETTAERVFDPDEVYNTGTKLESAMRQLYDVYIYLRDNDLSTESNTSRLLQEHTPDYLAARLADELQELADVQSGEHFHSDRQSDTTLEGSQVQYWLLLLASTFELKYQDFLPHRAVLQGYQQHPSLGETIELRQTCLDLLTASPRDPIQVVRGLGIGFRLVGWACAQANISALAPTEFDLQQMKRKGLVQ